jgi:hypothetical protein
MALGIAPLPLLIGAAASVALRRPPRAADDQEVRALVDRYVGRELGDGRRSPRSSPPTRTSSPPAASGDAVATRWSAAAQLIRADRRHAADLSAVGSSGRTWRLPTVMQLAGTRDGTPADVDDVRRDAWRGGWRIAAIGNLAARDSVGEPSA